MVFNTTFRFNNISVILWRPILLLEETRVPGENNRPAASHCKTLPHNIGSNTSPMSGIRTHCIGGCKPNYHTITTTIAPETV